MSKYTWDKDAIKAAVKESTTYSNVLRLLKIPVRGNSISTLKRKIKEYNISTEHLLGRRYTKSSEHQQYKPASEYLKENISVASSKLKYKLIVEGLKRNVCECCGITEWNNKPIIMQLHHINGNNKDNRIENLQILCPNCHSQTDNYCGSANKKEVNYCILCGKEILKSSTYCVKCGNKNRRKLIATKETILKDLEELKSYRAVGRKYNVSDSAIRKRLKE